MDRASCYHLDPEVTKPETPDIMGGLRHHREVFFFVGGEQYWGLNSVTGATPPAHHDMLLPNCLSELK
jgi:hypothetical protein